MTIVDFMLVPNYEKTHPAYHQIGSRMALDSERPDSILIAFCPKIKPRLGELVFDYELKTINSLTINIAKGTVGWRYNVLDRVIGSTSIRHYGNRNNKCIKIPDQVAAKLIQEFHNSGEFPMFEMDIEQMFGEAVENKPKIDPWTLIEEKLN